MAWQLSREQAAGLLKYRCRLISCDIDIDDAALSAGEPAACIPIMRYVFTHFSQALDDFLKKTGHNFHRRMTDAQLVEAILHAWPVLSPHAPVALATAPKIVQKGAWGTDRLLFTLQCVLVCAQKHHEIVSEREVAYIRDGINWTDTTPQQQFHTHPLMGTDSERARSTYAWMAEAYREQMAGLKGSSPTASSAVHDPNRGTANQQAWIERMLASAPTSSGSSATSSSASNSSATASAGGHEQRRSCKFNDDQPKPSAGRALQRREARAAYAEQLEGAGMPHLTGSMNASMNASKRATRARQALAQRYNALMGSLKFGNAEGQHLKDSDGFDDALLERGFIADSDSDASSGMMHRVSQSAPIVGSIHETRVRH